MEQPRTRNSTDSFADTLSSSRETSKITAVAVAIKNLDRIISRYGDASFVPYCHDENEYGNGASDSNDNNDDDKVISNNNDSIFMNDSGIVKTYAPKGLEEPFQQLFSVLRPCLVPTPTTNKTNNNNIKEGSATTMTASAILMGPPSGKTLLVERCLAACEALSASLLASSNNTTKSTSSSSLSSPAGTGMASTLYRKVSINGIVIRGEDVPSVIHEIIRQLSDIAFREKKMQQQQQSQGNLQKEASGDTSSKQSKKKRKTREIDQDRSDYDDPSNTTILHGSNSNVDATNDKQERLLQVSATEEENYLLRLRKSSFSSNLSLLESTFKIAEVDRIPIVLILDELDSFTDEGERQLLLYHLLDRVATPGSNLCLVATTSNFATLSLLEKRIRSRAEGTSKIIYVKPPDSYNNLISILQSKLELISRTINSNDERTNSVILAMNDDIMNCILLQPPSAVEDSLVNVVGNKEFSTDIQANHSTTETYDSTNATGRRRQTTTIRNCLRRAFRLGKDIRWFSRVMSCALSIYRFELLLFLDDQHDSEEINGDGNKSSTKSNDIPRFQSHYLMQALVTMGATFDEDIHFESVGGDHGSRSKKMVTDVDMHNNISGDNDGDNNNNKKRDQGERMANDDGKYFAISSDTRMQALFDLSTPQLAIIFCARRILTRDKHREELSIPLTIQRIFQEYESYRGSGSGGGSRNNKSHLWPAMWQLLERGLLVPTIDHSGGGALQYNFAATYKSMDSYTLSRLPMHMTLDIDHEIGIALKNSRNKGNTSGDSNGRSAQPLDCPTDLIEWGRKTN